MSCNWWLLNSILMLVAFQGFERRKVSIDDIIRSYNEVVTSVETWEGTVTVYKRDGNAPERLDALGTFAWDAVNDRRHCRLGYASRRGSLSLGKEVEWEEYITDRETVISGGIRTEAWHNLHGLPLQHFKMPLDRPVRHSAPTAKRDRVNPQSLLTPDLEFCPEYMFRGNLPPLVQLLTALRDHAMEAGSVDFRLVSENEFHIEITKESFHHLLIMKLQSGQWVPQSSRSRELEMNWRWAEAAGRLIPVHLQVVTKEANRQKVYVLSENRVNLQIPEARFEINAMAFSKGTLLEDVVADVLLEHDGEEFATLGDGHGASRDRLSTIRVIGLLSVLFGMIFVCREVVRQLRGR